MNRFLSVSQLHTLLLAAVLLLLLPFGNAAAEDEWVYKGEVYGWLPDIKGTAPNGGDVDIPLHDILSNLEFTFMGVFAAEKGKWTFITDLVYLKLMADEGGTKLVSPGPGNVLQVPTKVDFGVDMETWILNLAGSYRIHETDKHNVQLLAGMRYFSLDVTAELDTSIIPAAGIVVDGRDDVWDAIVGVRGKTTLSDRWWLAYRFDIGGGNSDKTLNAGAQLGYRYDWGGSLMLGYRYLHYDFDSDFELLKDLDVQGPLIGIAWQF